MKFSKRQTLEAMYRPYYFDAWLPPGPRLSKEVSARLGGVLGLCSVLYSTDVPAFILGKGNEAAPKRLSF